MTAAIPVQPLPQATGAGAAVAPHHLQARPVEGPLPRTSPRGEAGLLTGRSFPSPRPLPAADLPPKPSPTSISLNQLFMPENERGQRGSAGPDRSGGAARPTGACRPRENGAGAWGSVRSQAFRNGRVLVGSARWLQPARMEARNSRSSFDHPPRQEQSRRAVPSSRGSTREHDRFQPGIREMSSLAIHRTVTTGYIYITHTAPPIRRSTSGPRSLPFFHA